MALHSPTGVELCCVVPYHPGTFPEYLCKFRMPQVLCLVQGLYTKVTQGIAYVGFVSRNSKLSVLGLMFSKFPCQKAQHKHTVMTWFSPSSASNQVKPCPALRKQVSGVLSYAKRWTHKVHFPKATGRAAGTLSTLDTRSCVRSHTNTVLVLSFTPIHDSSPQVHERKIASAATLSNFSSWFSPQVVINVSLALRITYVQLHHIVWCERNTFFIWY